MTARPRARVGCCGFAEAQARLFADLDAVEVQRTFYQPPRPPTAARWRQRAGGDFLFTLKAWQLITHEATSPTYRRLREDLSGDQLARVGSFRWNPVTRMAWERTLEIAAALDAAAVVLQTPKSFTPSPANLDRLRRFLSMADRDGRRLVLEPRGEQWDAATVRAVVQECDLVHGVDPFLDRPVGRGLRYFRLHGLPAYTYSYTFTDGDLERLAGWLPGNWPAWVLFNNHTMADDARRFRRVLARS